MTTFADLLAAAQTTNRSNIILGIAPALDKLPAAVVQYDDPFLPFSRLVIDQTQDLVCGYAFHFGAFLATGGAGAIALERAMAYVPRHIPRILHGSFGNSEYARASFEDALGADAVTLAPTTDPNRVTDYLTDKRYGALVRGGTPSENTVALALGKEHPGQIGLFRRGGDQYYVLNMIDGPECHWYWGPRVYRSRALNFESVLREQIEMLRGASAE